METPLTSAPRTVAQLYERLNDDYCGSLGEARWYQPLPDGRRAVYAVFGYSMRGEGPEVEAALCAAVYTLVRKHGRRKGDVLYWRRLPEVSRLDYAYDPGPDVELPDAEDIQRAGYKTPPSVNAVDMRTRVTVRLAFEWFRHAMIGNVPEGKPAPLLLEV